jgi:hypothetical protein
MNGAYAADEQQENELAGSAEEEEAREKNVCAKRPRDFAA